MHENQYQINFSLSSIHFFHKETRFTVLILNLWQVFRLESETLVQWLYPKLRESQLWPKRFLVLLS